jgi:hypothetical protein
MDRQVGNQGLADGLCEIDRLDDVGCLRDRNVPGAPRAIVPPRIMLPIKPRYVSA